LRYVRLFYGAMVLFAEKHFENRHSRFFSGLLKLAIVGRAGLSMLSNTARRLGPLVLDFALVYAVVTLVGYGYSSYLGAHLSPSFLFSVAPGYALGTLMGMAMLGGYRRNRQRPPRRSVVLGAALGLLIVAAASFFIKGMAYSRVVVLLSYPLVVVVLLMGQYVGRNRHAKPRRALLVGHAAEARRLQALLDAHPHPPFVLEGYVDALAAALRPADGPARLGTLHHLRDLVRLRRIDDVVFAADGLTNRTIFGLMQRLRDQPVQFRMLAGGRQHIIGKATIDDLSMPALLETPLKAPRSLAARRAFEIPVALFGLALHPFIRLFSRHSAFLAALAERTRQLGAVLRGDRLLIGYRPDDPFCPPEEWNLGPGVFAVTDTLGTPFPTREACSYAYWYYISHQSAAADWDVIARALRNMRT
jgi:hypothetical protein